MTTADDFISHLVEDGYPTQPWIPSTFENNFILLSEFSEMVGPKPIFTIPLQHNSKFNLNTFAVRIMSVDCVSIMQTTDFSTFNIAGDIQVVLTELKEGAVAYVHHFVLYDICARGFVRPFCVAYISRNYTELMGMFTELLEYFQAVSSLYHFGNTLSFLNDLTMRTHHLLELKRVLRENIREIRVDGKMLSPSQMESITIQSLDEAIQQLKDLAKVFKSYCERDMFTEHRDIFQQRYSDVIENCRMPDEENVTMEENITSGCSVTDRESHFDMDIGEANSSLNVKPVHDVPADIMSSILGKKYDKSLRNLNALCDVTFNSGVEMLKHCLDSLTHDHHTMHLSPSFTLTESLEQASKFQLGTCQFPIAASLSSDGCCWLRNKKKMTSLSLKAVLSTNGHTFESQIHDKLKRVDVDGSQKAIMDISSSFLSELKRTDISSPVNSAPKLPVRLDSYVNIPSMTSERIVDGQWTMPHGSVSGVALSGDQSEGSCDSFKDALEDLSSKSSTDSIYTNLEFNRSSSVVSSASNLSNGPETLRYSKVSLLTLRRKYCFLSHAVYSILIGRPLIVLGEEKHMKHVRQLVYSLGNFLVRSPHNARKVIPWTTDTVTLKDVGKVGVCGLLKGGNAVPNSLKPYVSILDYENQTLNAPKYCGDFLAQIFDAGKVFTTENTYRKFVQQVLSEILNIVYVQFSAQYAQCGKYVVSNNYGQRMYSDIHMIQGKLLAGDLMILRELVRELRQQFFEAVCGEYEDSFEMVVTRREETVKLNNLKCYFFTNKKKR